MRFSWFSKSPADPLDLDFLQEHLDRTSRSFAFCIKKLNPPFRQWISLCYLLCRILDTVEDSQWPSQEAKVAQFDQFEKFISSKPAREEVQNWIRAFPSGIAKPYLTLIEDSERLFKGLHEKLDPEALKICQKCILKMKDGMKFYSLRAETNSLQLPDLGEVNRYCFFVAGIVGELIRKLYCHYRSAADNNPQFKLNSVHFGLYLQKINLLKDFREDEAEGRHLIPNRGLLVSSLKENALGAFRFLMNIPLEEKGFRLFCAWSLFIGLASLKVIEANKNSRELAKLPKLQAMELIAKIESIINRNETLQSLFDTYFADLKKLSLDHVPALPTPAWFSESVGGILSLQEIEALRL